jgi:phosphoribosyl-ATP pyrophosphohydrolase/phosphoribosyl-AMP cyclohydrolase
MELRFDQHGLLPAVAQDARTGRVLMVAWMNAEAVAATRATGLATFWSRSRGKLWQKGESSGHTLIVRELRVDCDGDTLLLLCEAAGPACHTGAETCFFTSADGQLVDRPAGAPVGVLARLEQVIEARRDGATGERSYTRSLLDGGMGKILAKLAEEHGELAVELDGGPDDKVVHESADVIFHLLVALAARDVPLARVCAELERRFGQSGHAEKASRQGK